MCPASLTPAAAPSSCPGSTPTQISTTARGRALSPKIHVHFTLKEGLSLEKKSLHIYLMISR